MQLPTFGLPMSCPAMPSSTPKQSRFFRAVAHGFKPDRVEGPPVSVAKEFVAADEAKADDHRKRLAKALMEGERGRA